MTETTVWRTQPQVVATWRAQGIIVENFIKGGTVAASQDILSILGICAGGAAIDDILRGLRVDADTPTRAAVESAVTQLCSAGLLAADGGSKTANSETWTHWGPEAQYFHWATKDAPYLESDDTKRVYADKLATTDQPALFKSYPHATRIFLPRSETPSDATFQDVLRGRRTRRIFSDAAVPLAAFARTLEGTFGPTLFIDAGVFGVLPFHTYANAGARSEVEAYVTVSNVEGVDNGLYHYNLIEHSLEHLSDPLTRDELDFAAYQQPMVTDAAAVIFLTSVVARLGHKYRHPRSLRAMYMDLGHVGQTFAMVATANGLGPNQTAAFRDTFVEGRLGIDGVEETAGYCLAVGMTAAGDFSPMSLAAASRTQFVDSAYTVAL